MAERKSVKIVSGALFEEGEEIILRGVISPDSLNLLKVDTYQREVLNRKKIEELKDPVRRGVVPDIVLGVRGHSCSEREKDGVFYISDDVYVMDGQQRLTAARELFEADPHNPPNLGAKIWFGTDRRSERDQFTGLNTGQTGLSANVLLRNAAEDVPAVDALKRLTADKGFVLCNQVCWGQNMRRGDLITAITYVKVAGMLQSHAGPGRGGSALELAGGLQKIMENVGKASFVFNVRYFFEAIDICWGVKVISYRAGANYMKATFLIQLAKFFSNHTNFWDGDRFAVDPSSLKKLSQFPVNDPHVGSLASSGGTAGDILYSLFVEEYNKGKRTRKLVPRRSLHDRSTALSNEVDAPESE